MKILEVRRHAYTKQGTGRDQGSALSADGVRLAREVGGAIGPFAHVLASTSRRTLETALAMGFAVDELVEMGGPHWDAATVEIDHRSLRAEGDLYLRYLDRFGAGGAVTELGRQQAALWESAVARIDDGESVLAVSHGGLIEPGLVAALPEGWDHARWGRGFEQCEGARLAWSGRFTDAEILRLR